ncbi:MAG: hypothetical protein ABIK89_13530 [Planctomycetota bacterium]
MTVADDILDQVTERYEQQLVDEELHRLPAGPPPTGGASGMEATPDR